MDMLDSLMEIEVAYSLLQSAQDENANPIDANYAKLHCNLQVCCSSLVSRMVMRGLRSCEEAFYS